jgi:hypothetical protein
MYQQPGPTPNYGQPDFSPPSDPLQTYNGGDLKSQGTRFKPKNRINDPIFLIFFALQVRLYRFITLLRKAMVSLVSRIHRPIGHCLEYMDITRRVRGRPGEGWRANGQSRDIEQVLTFSFILTFLFLIYLSTGAPSICCFLLRRWQCSSQSFISS